MIKYISASLIQRTINNKEEFRALSLAFAIKAKFTSSQINNFSYSRISEIFGISRGTAKKHITTLRQMGLIRNNDKGIVILALKDKTNKGQNFRVQKYGEVIKPENLKDIEKFLRLQKVLIKQNQIDFAVNTLKAKDEVETMRDYRKLVRRSKKLHCWAGELDRGQSIKTICNVTGLSNKSSVELLKWGENNKFLTKEKRITKTDMPCFGIDEREIKGLHGGSYFIFKGSAYFVQPSILNFNIDIDVKEIKSAKTSDINKTLKDRINEKRVKMGMDILGLYTS